MRSSTRHQLKQDSFTTHAVETYSWAVDHRRKLEIGGIIGVAALALLIGAYIFWQYREDQAGSALGQAMKVYDAQLRPADAPADPNVRSYTSAAERSKAAQAEFKKVAEGYSYTRPGHVARYLYGLTSHDVNDNTTAERELKAVAEGRYPDLAALAKFAMASLYRDTNREAQAVAIYKDLMDHPARSVSKAMAELALAELYQAKQPAEARRIYEQVAKDDPKGFAGELAQSRLKELQTQP